ncbi:MAG: pilus assembly protein PilM [Candidatus Hydrogenedentes bacterium]|nr:pilus assembly protein PilM [Candidatus Hydrogenedentota bacterium]
MSLYRLRKGKKRIVLEISTTAVRLCEFSRTKTGLQLVKYIERVIPYDPRMDEEQRKEQKRKAISDVLKEAKINSKRVIVAVPGQSVFVRVRSLPPVSESKVDQIVKYEIQQQIPFDLRQIAIDYQILAHPEGGGYEVLMSAIKVDVVDKFLSVLEGMRLQPDIVDVVPFASYSWLKHVGEIPTHGECIALIDLGASTTNILVEKDGILRNTRTLNIGGNDITQAIADTFNIPFDEAERLKCEKGFAPTGNPQIDGKGGEAIGKVLNRLVNEIQRSFSYFRSLPGGAQVTRIYVCGGGSALKNIVPFLRRALGVDVKPVQPLSNISVSPQAQSVLQHPERASVVLGLGLRNWQDTKIDINLIPPRILEVRRRKEQAVYWAFSMVTLALIMASVIPVHANQNKLVKQRIEELKRYVAMYDPEVAQNPVMTSPLKQSLAEAKTQIESLKKKVEALDRARLNRRFWLDELALVASARPPRTDKDGIWFSSVETVVIQEPQQGLGAPQFQPRLPQISGLPQQTASQKPTYNVTGFPGIGARTGIVGTGGGRGGVFGGGAPLSPISGPPQQQTQQQTQIPGANGLRIMGLATSDSVIKSFVENLEKVTQTLPDGTVLRFDTVIFSEASVQPVGWDVLYNAQTAFQGSGLGANVPVQQSGGPRGLGLGSGPGAPQSVVGRGTTTYLGQGQNLYTFVVTVRLKREKPSMGTAQAGGGGA